MVRPLLESPGREFVVSVPPPPHFRPLRPPLSRVRMNPIKYERSKGDTAAREAGLRFEERVQEHLLRWHIGYIAAPYIHFHDQDGPRTLQPDGLYVTLSRVWIFEVKSQHMPEAWWQLEKLYKPVIQELYKHRPVTCIEIVKSFDPAMPFPGKFDIISAHTGLLSYDGDFGVCEW